MDPRSSDLVGLRAAPPPSDAPHPAPLPGRPAPLDAKSRVLQSTLDATADPHAALVVPEEVSEREPQVPALHDAVEVLAVVVAVTHDARALTVGLSVFVSLGHDF